MQSPIRWLAFGLLFLTSVTACSTGSKKEPIPHEEVPLVGTFKVHRYKLENGLKLLVVEDHSSPTFAYQTWFKVGSRDEKQGYTGLAHLFEHMMFKQTKNIADGEFDRILEGAGAEGQNAFTSRDYTAYVQELPSDKLELIARVESDRMVNLIVDQKAFKTETEVVQNERRYRNENSPDGLMYQELFDVAFTVHPYHWPVIGYQEDLDRMNAENAVEFYQTYYSPNHATIIVSGDVEPDQVFETVRKFYGDLKAREAPQQNITPEPPQTSPKRKRMPLNMQVEKLMMGYRIPHYTHEDMAAINVLQAVLSGGKSARLHRALVETGIANGVDAYELEGKDPSLFLVAANLQKGKSASQAEALVLREIANLGRVPVSKMELERAKNRIGFGFFTSLESNAEKANFLGRHEAIAGSFEVGIDQYKKIQTVTAADIQRVVATYLNPKTRTVITGVPK